MLAIYRCDKCGALNSTEDYDGNILCEYHRAEHDLYSLRRKYKEKSEWIEKVHLAPLGEMSDKIQTLELYLTEHKPLQKGHTMIIEEPKTITQCECLRCKGKPWWPREGKTSFRCPRCHSKYWNVPPRPGKLRRKFVEQGVTV